MLTRRDRPESGFTLAEVLVAIVVIVALTAITIPTVRNQIRNANTDAIAGEINTLATSIQNYRTNVGRYPSQLSYLTFLPAAGVNDICGVAYAAANYTNWHGPYINRNITANYAIAEDDTVSNATVRSPAAQNNAVTNYLRITISYVDSLSAVELDEQFDGIQNNAAGNILWVKTSGANQAPLVQLTYQMPIRGC